MRSAHFPGSSFEAAPLEGCTHWEKHGSTLRCSLRSCQSLEVTAWKLGFYSQPCSSCLMNSGEITAHPTQPTLIQAPTMRPAASAAVCLSSLGDGSACRGVSEVTGEVTGSTQTETLETEFMWGVPGRTQAQESGSRRAAVHAVPLAEVPPGVPGNLPRGRPGGSDGRECLQCGRPGFDPWIGTIPWRMAWQPTPVSLPGESQGWRSLAGYSPWGHTESASLSDFTFFLSLRPCVKCPYHNSDHNDSEITGSMTD